MIFEICVDSLESAWAAEQGGANRLELCAALSEGGLTPSPAFVEAVLERTSLPVHAMLRPRGGDFFYTKAEFTLMRRELAWLRRSGVTGIVLGLLMEHGAVDADHLRILVEEALPLDVTFHRAFDSCSDPLHALEVIIAAGVKRLLTSGQKATAHEGASLIQKLIAHSSGRIVIMPGGGITPHNIREILDLTGAREIHFSASTWYEVPSPVATGRRITTAQLVERMIAAAKTAV